MPVTIVTDRWDENGGGRERYVAELAAFLRSQGDTVHVRCRAAAANGGRIAEDVEVFGRSAVRSELRLARSLRAYRTAHPDHPILSTRPCPDATHYQLHSGLYATSFLAERDSFSSRLRRAFFGAGLRLNVHRTLALRAEASILAGPLRPKLMVFSTMLRDELVRDHAVPPGDILVARPGVDLRLFHPAPPGSPARSHSGRNELRLLFVGHNFALKGLRCVIDALARLRASGVNASLVVAGRGHEARYRRAAGSLGVESAIHFPGAVNQRALAELYRSRDVLVHPTFYDPFPRVAVEALACGCPVLTTRRCGASELITDGENGFLVDDPRDSGSVAAAVASVIDPDALDAMRTRAASTRLRHGFDEHAREVWRWLRSPKPQPT
jgi:UDP-glucose:(heptosyl)LPS alpha-1,3-glucosyltransferase